jgi:hypothetical protein
MGLAPVWPLGAAGHGGGGLHRHMVRRQPAGGDPDDLPDAYRGRVMSLWTVVGFGTVAIGAGLIGGLAEVMWDRPRAGDGGLSRTAGMALWRFGGARG